MLEYNFSNNSVDLVSSVNQVTVDDCKEIVAACMKHNVILSVCHVLRYSPAVLKVKVRLLES